MGMLLLVDAALTVTWQEPVSSLLAARSQSQLERELESMLRIPQANAAQPTEASDRAELAKVARQYRESRSTGSAVAQIELPTLGRRYVVVEGTDTRTLRKGPAHYPETPLPGEAGTVAVAGHRTTYLAPFRTIDRLRAGDPVVLTLPYGRFSDSVERTRVVAPDATWVKRAVGYERLILTACHPLYSAAKRIVVFARLRDVSFGA